MADHVIIKLNPDPEEYEAAEQEFLAAIGLCITQWAFVDRQFYRLFNFGLESKRSRSAAIYYRQNSLNQRLTLTSNVLQEALTEADFKELWKPLYTACEKLIPTRNIIVHHPPKRSGSAKEGKAVYLYSIHIEPYELILNRRHGGLPKGKNEITVKDLEQHAEKVDDLHKSLIRLVEQLLPHGRAD